MSVRSNRMTVHLFVAIVASLSVALLAGLALSSTAGASMKGSYYKAMLKEKKSKKRASKATRAAMKGTDGFYGFKLKPRYIPGKNGTLIWARNEGGPKNAVGASKTHNILYSSKTFPGDRKTVVSGTVMVPKGKAPKRGWPVISWAHGTVGLADQCAPSRRLGSSDYYGSESGQLISGWLKAGYAVVATDYEGLGTPGVHPYLVGNSEGRSVLDMVLAARQLDGRISKRVALAGHSQGGQAILFAANLATTSWGRGASYLGTVSYAPVSNLDAQAPIIGQFDGQEGQYGISALALSILRGAVAGDPSIDPAEVLTEDALAQYPKTETLCLGELSTDLEAQQLQPGELLKEGWPATTSGQKFTAQLIAMNPDVKVGARVLIPQGSSDGTVLPLFTQGLITQLEATNPEPGRITYEVIPGATHSSVLLDSRATVTPFIRSLFK